MQALAAFVTATTLTIHDIWWTLWMGGGGGGGGGMEVRSGETMYMSEGVYTLDFREQLSLSITYFSFPKHYILLSVVIVFINWYEIKKNIFGMGQIYATLSVPLRTSFSTLIDFSGGHDIMKCTGMVDIWRQTLQFSVSSIMLPV